MSKKINIEEVMLMGIGFAGLVTGLVGIGYGLAKNKQMKKVCDKLDTTIDDISKTIEVDVPKYMLDEAVDRAVENEVHKAVRNLSIKLEKDIHKEIETEVRESIRVERERITESVTKQITDEIAKINVKSLSKVVREDARDKIAKKFDGELDDILEKFNENLDSVSKVYSSISKRFVGTSDGKDLKISLM